MFPGIVGRKASVDETVDTSLEGVDRVGFVAWRVPLDGASTFDAKHERHGDALRGLPARIPERGQRDEAALFAVLLAGGADGAPVAV